MKVSALAVALLIGSAQAMWPFKSKTISAAVAPPRQLTLQELEQLVYNDENGIPNLEFESPPAPSSPVYTVPVVAPVIAPVVPFTGYQLVLPTPLGTLRVRPYGKELFVLIALALYAFAGYFGAAINRKRANAWFNAHQERLNSEFSALGLDEKRQMVQDGGDAFVVYTTGRRGVSSLRITLRTAPYQDVLKFIYQTVYHVIDSDYRSGANTVELEFSLRDPIGQPGAKFVYAIAAKQGLRSIRSARWDLATFTAINDDPSAIATSALPPSLISMHEHSEIEASLLGPANNVAANLNGVDLEHFTSLAISDMPSVLPEAASEKPEDDKPVAGNWRITLSLALPPVGEERATLPFIEMACNLADVLYSRTNTLGSMALYRLKQNRARKLSEIKSGPALAITTDTSAKTSALARKPDKVLVPKTPLHAKSTKESAKADKAWADAAFEALRTRKPKSS